MINIIYFSAKNLTSNAELFLLLENAKNNAIFEMIEKDLVFESDSVNKINRHFPMGNSYAALVREFDISVKEPETVSGFLGKFNFKTTQMFREINFKVFKKLLLKSKTTSSSHFEMNLKHMSLGLLEVEILTLQMVLLN